MSEPIARDFETDWEMGCFAGATPHGLAKELHEARAAIRERDERIAELSVRLAAGHDFGTPPCPICDYNGEGYFQPDKHPCATMYHAARKKATGIVTQGEIDDAARRAVGGAT